ncbi:MAG: hypothetical protein J6Y48_08250 [Clostridia bacterium]|nr:hypothetical protein [Clostridia bacterium]
MKQDELDRLLSYKERICENCGKQFMMQSADWVYRTWKKNLPIYFCSWKCMREYEQKHPKDRAGERERIIQALKDGLSVQEIRDMLGADVGKIQYWKNKLEGRKDA